MIIVAGYLLVKASKRTKFLKSSVEAVVLARQTKGCIDFSVSADPIDKNRVNILEIWKSRKALNTFRGNGPSDDLSSLIDRFELQEFEAEK